MNVKELRRMLADVPGDLVVVLASDEEGNSYSECGGYNPDDYCFDAKDQAISERKVGPRCLVLWP